MVDTADDKYLATKKPDDEMMISPDAGVSALKIVMAEDFVLEAVKIDADGNHMTITLRNQDTTVLLWIVVLGFKIRYLETIVFPLVFCLADVVTKE